MSLDYSFNGIPELGSLDFEALAAFCDANRSAVLGQLPWVVAEIAADVGFPPMLRLVHAAGGQRIALTDGSGLERLLGVAVSARTLARITAMNHAVGYVELPSAWGVFLAVRRAAILRELSCGRPQREIASRFGVTTRYLRKLRSDRPAAAEGGTGPRCRLHLSE